MKRKLFALAFGVLAGALVGAFIQAADYYAFLTDLSHYGIDPFGFGEVGYLVQKALGGAWGGAWGALGGAVCGVLGGFSGAKARKVAIVAAGSVVLAVFGFFGALAVIGVTGVFSAGVVGGIAVVSGWPAGLAVSSLIAKD